MTRVVLILLLLTSALWARPYMPYREAGLTQEEAAAHLLSRFTFGARPGQVEEVSRQGLEVWFEQQLKAQVPAAQPSKRGSLWDLRKRKVKRAVDSKDQVLEVMTDFWFNHFNVSFREAGRASLAHYEDAAIRAHALGRFQDLLDATAHHPAMLIYLNNDRSRARGGGRAPETGTARTTPLGYGGRSSTVSETKDALGYGPGVGEPDLKPLVTPGDGINENYARELMELHTLGVDGGYTQQDVVEVARALSGWGVADQDGFSEFRFTPNSHDNGEKVVLHRKFPAGGGVKEGEKILELLARHPSTAEHVARKIAVRFVSDHPPESLVKKLKTRFMGSNGSIPRVLETLVTSPEFWKSRGQKVKTPFELCVSAVRLTGADVKDANQLTRQIEEMGQPLYGYQPPTGFPDRAEFWINPGTLARRMNFGLLLMTNSLGGVKVMPPEYRRKPRNALDALSQQADGLLDKKQLKRLVPLVEDKELESRVQKKARGNKRARKLSGYDTGRVMGIVIGSPQFQKR